MKMYASFALALFMTGAISMKAPPDTLWTKIFGGDNGGGCVNNPGDVGRIVEITDDENFIISGWTNSYGLEDTDVWLVSTDAQGNETWSHVLTVSADADDAVYDMKQTRDGGFILTGITDIEYCSGGHGGRWACGGKVLLIRTNEVGDTLWTHKYDGGDRGWSEGRSVEQTSDGGFVIVGRADTEENGSDIWMSLTNDKGEVLWTHIFASNGYDEGRSIRQTDDDGFVIAGLTQPQDEESQKAWLIRTNELGDTLWTQKYLVGDWTEGRSVLQTDDGGFLIAGTAESWEENLDGKVLIPPSIQKSLKGKYLEDELSFTKNTINILDKSTMINLYSELKTELNSSEKTNSSLEHYKSVLNQNKVIEERDALLIRTNELGEMLWTGIYGGPGWDDINSVCPTSDGGFILAGEKYVERNESQDIWLIRTNEQGDTLWTTTLGDGVNEIAYDVKQTSDNGYIVTGTKYNEQLDVEQTWLIRFGEGVSGIELAADPIPTEFVLEQNYPNPFNPRTIINYELPITNYVELKIYNILGQEVTTLFSEKQNAGYHQVEWDAARFSSGVYYYRITAGEFQNIKKMILTK